MSASDGELLAAFIARWRQSAAAERANKDSFLNDLCAVLGVPPPNPTTGNAKRDDYVFEKAVVVAGESGKTTKFIDLYKRGSFVLEAKQGSESSTGKLGTAKRDTPTWNVAMNAAFGQAIGYAAALDEAPPFVIVTDIGYCFDVYASFDGTPRYRPFPNALDHRFYITRLAERANTLRRIFLEPLSLDPSKVAVEVTREVAVHLAKLTKRLEKAGHAPQLVADFLMRCIFTMFAEDVGLLPEEVFTKALKELWIKNPRSFPGGVETLWSAMNEGSAFGFLGKLLHFNGGLFKSPAALPLDKDDLEVLLTAARCSWNKVEPAIFGALLEGALDKRERHHLGAHFTPRPYVERLVRPTIEEPIREAWNATQSRIRALASSNKIKDAKAEARDFMRRLSDVRVLDPACGSGNFLYVALDLLKSVEDEAFALLLALEGGQTELCLNAPEVTPKQFLGIETNPRAKAIAELVLWIGYLQWHFRTKHRGGKPREPVLEDYKNIECRDALLAYDAKVPALDPTTGKPIQRWDGETMKAHPVTRELVPDERFTKPVYEYIGPRRAEWPRVDFIVGNPPFIGNKRMRQFLTDEYVAALRHTYADVPESADYVMYWWSVAAQENQTRRFGLISTNSITQSFNRRVVEQHLGEWSLVFAIPDHPWVDSSTGAAVRIAMTVAARGAQSGRMLRAMVEAARDDGTVDVQFSTETGEIGAALTLGVNAKQASRLAANRGMSFMGVTLCGQGFLVSDVAKVPSRERKFLRPFVIGRDLNQSPVEKTVVDFFGLTVDEAREQAPLLFQRVTDTVKPERDQQRRKSYRDRWWIYAEPRTQMREALRSLKRYIVTCRTAAHRVFSFVDTGALVESTVIAIALDDAVSLGVLSSRVHVLWTLAAGGTLEDRPRYNNSLCFETFPFPAIDDQAALKRIARLAESIDAHRKQQQVANPDLTLTAMYNVLDKLRKNEPLAESERIDHARGLISVLKSLHEDLDAAVFDAYGWPRGLADEQIMDRLVGLNTARAQEEQAGMVRWLRPGYQRTAPVAVDTEKQSVAPGPGLKKSAPPKGPGLVAARKAKAPSKTQRKSGGKR